MSPPGLHLAYIYTPNGRFGAHAKNLPFGVYIYAKWRPGGDIFLVFTKRIYIRQMEGFGTPWDPPGLQNTYENHSNYLGILKPQGVPGGAKTFHLAYIQLFVSLAVRY